MIDVNDNYPIVSVNTMDGTTSGSGNTQTSACVPENSDIGSFVAHISVYDADTASSGQVPTTTDSTAPISYLRTNLRPMTHDPSSSSKLLHGTRISYQ